MVIAPLVGGGIAILHIKACQFWLHGLHVDS